MIRNKTRLLIALILMLIGIAWAPVVSAMDANGLERVVLGFVLVCCILDGAYLFLTSIDNVDPRDATKE